MRDRPLNILFISSAWPHGSTFGGQLRALHTARALRELGNVTLVIVGSDADDVTAMRETQKEFTVHPPVSPHIKRERSPLRHLRRLFDTRYLNIHGYAASPSDRRRVDTYVQDSDVAWILNSRTPNILQRWVWPHTHLDLDDIPSTYMRTLSMSASSFHRRWSARIQQVLLRRRERLFVQRFATLSVCSSEDRSYLGESPAVHVIPNGFPRPTSLPVRSLPDGHPRLGFIGLISYAPNLDGVGWFLKECWPAIRQAVPGIRFRLIGKGPEGSLRPTAPDVDALGWVEDPAREIATWSAMVLPIRLGGGTRIKLAEAFSRKCPVVSTSLGAFGYSVTDEDQLRLADSPQDFARACIEVVRDPAYASQMAERAWGAYLAKWTWDRISPKVALAVQDCLSRSSTNNGTHHAEN